MANELDLIPGLIEKYRPKPEEAQVDLNEQRKIARGNALAEAFRVILDATGGAKGADIQKRDAVNPVMKAVDNYYKIRDAARNEQSQWDKLQLGTELDALKQNTLQKHQTNEREESQKFITGERVAKETATATENAAERTSRENISKDTNNRYREYYNNQKEAQAGSLAAKYAQIETVRDRYRQIRPYGADKGVWISDPDMQKQINIPDDKRSQILSFMESDPNLKESLPFIKLQFGSVPPELQSEFLVADYYDNLTPETRGKIRTFLGENNPTPAPQTNNSSTPYPYFSGKGPLLVPQTPTIKSDKKSTIVQVEQPVDANTQEQALLADQVQYLQKIIAVKNYSPEVKRSAIYKYLVEQGFDKASAQSEAEAVYQDLIKQK